MLPPALLTGTHLGLSILLPYRIYRDITARNDARLLYVRLRFIFHRTLPAPRVIAPVLPANIAAPSRRNIALVTVYSPLLFCLYDSSSA